MSVPIRCRKPVGLLSKKEITDALGTANMKMTMAKFGWRLSESKQMDNEKVDCTYRAGVAIIDIQLKSSDLNKKGKWNWNITKTKGKEKEMAFYDRPFDFLFLVGVQLEEEYMHYYTEVGPAFIALIPGRIVIENFSKKTAKHLVLSLPKDELSKDPWKNYFGLENISMNLEKTKKQQEKEEELLEETRKNKL
jgi:hypothetical protein